MRSPVVHYKTPKTLFISCALCATLALASRVDAMDPGNPEIPPSASGNIDYEARASEGKFSFDFSKAEILDVVKAVSEITRKNFIVPERLKSQRITILSPTKISGAEAYQVFLAALEINGVTLVQVGKFYKLVASQEATQQPIPTCTKPGDKCPHYSGQMITVIIHLQHTEAGQVIAAVKGLVSNKGMLGVFAPTNALIVSEYAPNVTRLRSIIEALDVPGFQDELQLVQIKHAVASEIAAQLTAVFGSQKSRGAPAAPRPGKRGSASPRVQHATPSGGSGSEVQISRIVADDRTNQVIVKASSSSFETISQLIAKLDVPVPDGEEGRVHIYYMENAAADKVAATLASLAQGHPARRPPSRAHSGKAPEETAELFEGDIKVTADVSSNSLVVVATPRDYGTLKGIIAKLDRPRRQVYVEAAILEVSVQGEKEYGLDWHLPARSSKTGLGGTGTLGIVQSGGFTGKVSPSLYALMRPEALLGVAQGSIVGIVGKGMTIPVGGSEVTFPSFGVLLKWLETSSSAQVLSTPHILTTDNEPAHIEVGEKVPFRRMQGPSLAGVGGDAGSTGAAAALSPYANMFSSTERVDVSMKLMLTPHVSKDNRIRLEIEQQIEDQSRIDSITGQMVTANRSTKTVVVVEDQQTVVLGGLMRDKVVESENRIPILGELPLIGALFRKQMRKSEKVNLLLVLTPHIVRDASDFQSIFERKLNEYEEFADAYYGDLPAYRAHIDYRRTTGPLAHLMATVGREQEKLENGGRGDGSEILVDPEFEPQDNRR